MEEKRFTKIETPYKKTDFDTVLMRTCLLTCHLAHLARRPRAKCLVDHVSEQMHGWGPPQPRARTQSTSSLPSLLSFPPGDWGGELLLLLLLLLTALSIQDLGPWLSRAAMLWCSPDAEQSLFKFKFNVEQIQVTLRLVQATSGLQPWWQFQHWTYDT